MQSMLAPVENGYADCYTRHELSFHHACNLMIALCPLSQKGINLINENDTRLRLPCETEESSDEFIRFTVPLVC